MNGSRQSVGWLVLALLPAVAVVAAAFLFVPMYAAMYAPLADRLPAETHFLFGSYRWLCLIPAVVVLGVWFMWPRRRAIGAVASGFVTSALALHFGWWAGFQPAVILALIANGNGGS